MMPDSYDVKRVIVTSESENVPPDSLVEREWLVANGLGGYASGTISGVVTRRYHGLLVAALPSPMGRTVMLNNLLEFVSFPDGSSLRLTGEERQSCALQMHGNCLLHSFSLEMGLPVWRFKVGDSMLEKHLFMRRGQNTVQISYLLTGDTPLKLALHPAVHFRSIREPIGPLFDKLYSIRSAHDLYEIAGGSSFPNLIFSFEGEDVSFVGHRLIMEEFIYRQEERSGYEGRENLWSPGYFLTDLAPGRLVIMVASTETPEVVFSLTARESLALEMRRRQLVVNSAYPEARGGPASELVLAADQFITCPATRSRDSTRIHAAGDEPRTVIAGYHWFTDWGRDTMISLEGLTLLTGRNDEAGWILRTFDSSIREGLIPNMFPEGQESGRYNTADATLWFFHAVHRYLEYSHDSATLTYLFPDLLKILEKHIQGTLFGIHVDREDGLLTQGQQGYALTWMDAKVGDWVVTPRRGKAVEVNALWYNALRLMEGWLRQVGREAEADAFRQRADQAQESFNQRFWYEEGGYLFDVVDGERGNDPSCRPNQVLAISLTYPILQKDRWKQVLTVVKDRLYTPFGLRSLAPGHADYKSRYYGDIRSRDAAYHQGTVWAWLIGPLVDAWLKVYPENLAGAREMTERMMENLNEAGIGYVSEIFDADEPFTPRGCIAQAWSVAELLRAWTKTAQMPQQR